MSDITLPQRIPLFPLSGVLLLPGGRLPLHIFEPRYLDMVGDSLVRERIIGMVQPRLRARHLLEPPVCSIGCAGYISEHESLDDGRMLIALRGVSRFRVVAEVDADRLYRVAEVDWLPPESGAAAHLAHGQRDRLRSALASYLPLLDADLDTRDLAVTPGDLLVNQLAMHCPFSAMEKQALLETDDIAARASLLIDLLERTVLESWPVDESVVN